MYENLQTSFNFKSKLIWFILAAFFCFRLFIASYFPMTNDEVYYWDWSRHLQLSYVDAPPFVAWLSAFGTYFFTGSLGARFFVIVVHFISVVFLLLSLQLLFKQKSDCKLWHAVLLCLFAETIPIFNFESFMLLPDASLLCAISGCLYVLLKSIRCFDQNQYNRAFLFAIFVGIFLGLGFLSKYQIAPIGLGFLIGLAWYCGLNHWRFLLKYYFIVCVFALFVSSPVFIWNAQNHWSSFQFQTQHGFKGFHIQSKPFFLYFLRVLILLLPWYFYLFIKLVFAFFSKIWRTKKVEIVFVLPFLFLFFIILASALGKTALPHWAMPGFFLLIPWLVKETKFLTQTHKKFWKSLYIVSFVLAILIPTLPCLSIVKNESSLVLEKLNLKFADTNQLFVWAKLQNLLKEEKGIDIQSFPYSTVTPVCTKQQYPYLASTSWYWTAQIAFNFENNPRVFYFNADHKSYYQWRDQLEEFSGCRFLVLTDKSHFNQKELEKFMDIQIVKVISLNEKKFGQIYLVQGRLRLRSQYGNM